jgi:hypothetical protein
MVIFILKSFLEILNSILDYPAHIFACLKSYRQRTIENRFGFDLFFKWFFLINENHFFHCFMIFILAEVTYVINKTNLIKLVECNLFPNYLYVNVFHLVNPLVTIGVGFSIYFTKHSRKRSYVIRTANEKFYYFVLAVKSESN